jgi:hypothetical protein
MEGIYEPNAKFPFDKMTISQPTMVSGGNYFLKFLVDKAPMYLLMPKSGTKEGIIEHGKKAYCDLVFNNDNEELLTWMEDLEKFACQYIYDNREKWFETDMEKEDIENYFASPLKTYRSGKYYLARVQIPQRLGKLHLKLYDESRQSVEVSSVTKDSDVISIVEIQGIKCSARSFQIEMELKQMMTLEKKDLFANCLLGSNAPSVTKEEPLEESVNSEETREISSPVTGPLLITDSVKEEEPVVVEENSKPEEIDNIVVEEDDEDDVEDVAEIPLSLETKENDDAPENIHLEEMKEEKPLEINSEDPPLEIPLENVALEDLEVHLEETELPETDTVKLKARNEVYYEMYKEARKKAKVAKKLALDAYLEANKIKHAYNLNLESESDSDDEEWLSEMAEGL